MSVFQIVARLASLKTGVSIKVTEMSDNEDEGSDHDLLLGAMYAWEGEPEFSLSDAELSFRSNGHWSPENL